MVRVRAIAEPDGEGRRSPPQKTERDRQSPLYALYGTSSCPFTPTEDRTGTAISIIRSVWHFPVPVHPRRRPNGTGNLHYTLCMALSRARSPPQKTERERQSSIYALYGTFPCPFTPAEDRTGTAIPIVRFLWHFPVPVHLRRGTRRREGDSVRTGRFQGRNSFR